MCNMHKRTFTGDPSSRLRLWWIRDFSYVTPTGWTLTYYHGQAYWAANGPQVDWPQAECCPNVTTGTASDPELSELGGGYPTTTSALHGSFPRIYLQNSTGTPKSFFMEVEPDVAGSGSVVDYDYNITIQEAEGTTQRNHTINITAWSKDESATQCWFPCTKKSTVEFDYTTDCTFANTVWDNGGAISGVGANPLHTSVWNDILSPMTLDYWHSVWKAPNVHGWHFPCESIYI